MDYQDPEMNEILGPMIQPQANLAQLNTQLEALNTQEKDALIGMMGGAQP